MTLGNVRFSSRKKEGNPPVFSENIGNSRFSTPIQLAQQTITFIHLNHQPSTTPNNNIDIQGKQLKGANIVIG